MHSKIQSDSLAGTARTGESRRGKSLKSQIWQSRPFLGTGFDTPKLNILTKDTGDPVLQAPPTNDDSIDRDQCHELKQVEASLQSLLRGRVRELRLLSSPQGIVLRGEATTFYGKQLAQNEILKMGRGVLITNEIQVSRKLEFSLDPVS